MIYCKPCTDAACAQDGKRILIGAAPQTGMLSNTPPEVIVMDMWLEALAPSPAVRQWAAQHSDQPDQVREAYFKQLSAQPEHWMILLDYVRQGNLTLLYSPVHGTEEPADALMSPASTAELLAGFLEDELEKWHEASSPVCYAGLNQLL